MKTIKQLLNTYNHNQLNNEIISLLANKLDDELLKERYYKESVNYDILSYCVDSFQDYIDYSNDSFNVFIDDLKSCLVEKTNLLGGNFLVYTQDIVDFYIKFRVQIDNIVCVDFESDASMIDVIQYFHKIDRQEYPTYSTTDLIFSTVNILLHTFRSYICEILDNIDKDQFLECLEHNLKIESEQKCIIDKINL